MSDPLRPLGGRSRAGDRWRGALALTPSLVVSLAAVLAGICVIIALLVPDARPRVLLELLGFETTAALTWLLLRRARERAASTILVVGWWLMLAAASLSVGGVGGVAYLSFAVLVVVAGLLFGARGGVVVAALTLTIGILAPLSPGVSLRWPPALLAPRQLVVTVAAAYALLILLLQVVQRGMRGALARDSESLSLLQATMDSTTDGILVLDEAGRVSGHNQKLLELWRIPPELVAQRDAQKLLGYVADQLRDPEGFLRKARQLYDQPETVSFDVLEFQDGRVFERSSQPRQAEGRTVGRILTFRDVTERHRAEESRRRLEAELFQAQKMESLGRLAGGIAHDFNNILTAIVSYGELAKMDSSENPPALESLHELLRAAHRARELVNQILIFSRTSANERVPVRLHPIVRETLDRLRPSLPAGIEVVVEASGEDHEVLADPTQIHQVVTHLGLNAGQAMGELGGRLTVRLHPVTVSGAQPSPLPELAVGNYMVMGISDTGPGMDAATQARVFEPFFSTRAPGKGRGLGLAMVHSIVRNHVGGIAVESEQGKGTTFRVYIPVISQSSS